MPSEGFDQIQISCVALLWEIPVQNQKTHYPIKLKIPICIYTALVMLGYSDTYLLGTPVGPSKSVRTSQVSSHQRDKNYRQFLGNIFTIFINLHHTNTHNIYTYIALKNQEVSKLCPWPQCLPSNFAVKRSMIDFCFAKVACLMQCSWTRPCTVVTTSSMAAFPLRVA